MRLSRREKTFIGTGSAVLAVLLFWFGVVEPLQNRRDRYAELSARLQGDLAEIQVLADQYRELQSSRSRMEEAAGGETSPFAFLESLARESGLTGRIESMTPVSTGAEGEGAGAAEFDVRLSGIGLEDLVQFLYKIETSGGVFSIVNINIRPRYLNPDRLDVTLRLASQGAA